MDSVEAFCTIRTAVSGISRVVARNVMMLDDLAQRHRDMSGIAAVRKEMQAALPAIRSLRDACNRAIAELERKPHAY